MPDGFQMTAQERDHTLTARCEVWTNPFGWELRLVMDERGLQIASVVRSAVEMHALVETWRSDMLETGWQPNDASRTGKDPTTEGEIPPLQDDAPVPPLTTPSDTAGR